MNVAILRGRLSSPPREQQLASGDLLVSLEVTTRSEEGPADSVPVAWFPRSARVPRWGAGQDVVVVGRVRRRFFRTRGSTASRTEVVAEHVFVATRRAAISKAVDAAVAGLDQLGGAADG
jgi:single-strand DNA-binding protein